MLIVLILAILLAGMASRAARFLVVDEPVKADAILVLAGETNVRPRLAIELLRRGVAPRVLLNAEMRGRVYDQRLIDLAQKFINDAGEASRASVCPVEAFSTTGEAEDARRCLAPSGARRVLVVTSDFHSRRALMILRHRLPEYDIHMAAARNPEEFGDAWWTRREWAKNMLDEWMKIVWWEAVDRWRG